ncbi:conserved hypothetical protein [Cupriavidus taiwanensis]|uniref:hypothetical protein n=1 Tax=Cupriavidus taiwanensis TaxID=164546 RepID=UPI000E18AFB7|nr:hypothetical protein [Cupriavidus taiwanensis]SPA00508.1 conserved hypothetical protein [Cupriavidus taiwanensis]
MADTQNIVVDQIGQDMPAVNPNPTGVIQHDEVAERLNQPDAWDVAGATWRLDTVVGQATNHLQFVGQDTKPDPTFNPYTYLEQNRKQYEDLLPLIANGAAGFGAIQSREAFEHYAAVQRKNLKDREIIARGDGGNLLLNMGASMLDVTSLVSIGGLAATGIRGATLGARIARGAAAGAADVAAQESLLQNMDASRTAEDAFMNIGTATFLGAGLGAVFKHLPADSVLRPGHPDNPLHPDNFDKVEVNEHHIGQLPGEGDSIGAMRATTGTEGSEIAVGKGTIAKAVDSFFALAPTPLGRLTRYQSEKGRETLLSLYDTGGLMTKAMARGEARPVEAETLKTIYDQRAQAVRNEVAAIYEQANMDLGQSKAGTAARGLVNTVTLGSRDINVVPQVVFNDAITDVHIARRTGDTDGSVKVMKRLTDAGLSPEDAKLVHKRVFDAANKYRDAYESIWAEAEKMGLADPKLKGDGEYGMPQLWVKSQIDANPEQFRALMQQHLGSRPMEQWLIDEGYIKDPNAKPKLDGEGKPIPEATPYASWDDIVKSGDSTLQNDILKAWRGEEQDHTNDFLTAQLQAHEQRQLKAQDELADLLKQLGKAETDYRAARLSEMKAEGRAIERGIVTRSVAAASLKAERAEAKVKELLARNPDPEGLGDEIMQGLKETGHQIDAVGPRVAEAAPRKTEADSLVSALRAEKAETISDLKAFTSMETGMEKSRGLRPLRDDHYRLKGELRDAIESQRVAQRELADAQKELERLSREQAGQYKWLDAAMKDIETLKANEADALLAPGFRAQEIGNMDKLAVLKRALEDATAARKAAYDLRRQLGDDVKAARKAVNRSATQLRRTAFRAKRGIAAENPLNKYVQQLSENLRGHDRAPRGLLLDEQPTTGRLKERQFNFSPDEYQRFRELGMLEANADDAFMRYAQDMGGQMAVHKAMNGKKVDEAIREVNEDYDRLIGSAKTEKERQAFRAQRDAHRDDIRHAYDRILGKYDPKDHNGLVWAADKLKMMGLIRYMGGFIFSAIGDLATAQWSAPGSVMHAITLKTSRDYKYILEQARKGDPDMKELEMILGTFETGLHLNMSDKALGRGSVRDHIGFGSGVTKEITSKVDQYMDLMADAGNKLSGLAAYSDVIRRSAGLVQLANIRNWVSKYGSLSAGKKADLANLGIGEVEAKRLNELFSKYGTEQRRGLFSPGMTRWLSEADGEEMKYVLESALTKAQKRASYTSGFGNQPLLMDKWYGKLFLQFQSNAFQFTNNFMRAGIQRGAVTGEHFQFAQAIGIGLAAGVLMNAIASFRKGEDVTKQEPQQMAYNVIQRSGLLGFLGSYVDAGVKLTDPVLKSNFGFTLGGGASKFGQNSWLANLMGPWWSTFESISGIGANAVNGDFDSVGEKAFRLLPLNQQLSLLIRIAAGNDDDRKD